MTADVDVIVFDEDKFVGKLPVAHQLGDLLEHALTGLVERMRLPRKHELDRAFRIIDHGRDFLDVGQNQISALVGGKAAGKTDSERIGTEHAFELLQARRAVRRGGRPA